MGRSPRAPDRGRVSSIVAGFAKFSDPAGNVRAVRAYQILPEPIVPTVGHALPTIEI